MKQGIHPDYKPTTIVCSCGNTIETMSTQDEIHVEICAVCHPFYTGRQRLVDTAGRVERFKRKYEGGGESDEDEEKATAASGAKSPEGGDDTEEAADAE